MSLVELSWQRNRILNDIAYYRGEADRGGPKFEKELTELRAQLADVQKRITEIRSGEGIGNG